MSTLSILLIEDDAVTATLYKKLLSDAGYVIHVASDTQNATSVLSQENIHLVLLDYELPDANGAEWLAKLRENTDYETLPVILISYIQRETNIRQDKYVWFMEKPSTPQHIITAVEHTIRHFDIQVDDA